MVLVITRAPASRASSGVPSIDPSSTTITSSTIGLLDAYRTIEVIVADSFNAGITTVNILPPSPSLNSLFQIMPQPFSFSCFIVPAAAGANPQKAEHDEQQNLSQGIRVFPFEKPTPGFSKIMPEIHAWINPFLEEFSLLSPPFFLLIQPHEFPFRTQCPRRLIRAPL